MLHNSSAFRARVWYVLGFYTLGMMSLVVYKLQLQFSNAYMGFLPIELSPTYLSMVALFSALLGILVPIRLERPSEFFLVLYAVFVMLSFVFFAVGANQVGFLSFLFRIAISLVPFITILLANKVRWKLIIPFTLRWETLVAILFAFAASGVAVAIYSSGSSGGFSIADMYERRMVGRDIFQAGSLIAYLNVMSMNGINPFIAFLGGFLNRKSFVVLAIAFSIVFFYSIGVKAPIAFTGLAYVIGVGVRTQNLSILFKIIIAISTLLFLGFLIEYFINGYSEIAEYFFRRIFVIPGFDIQRYLDLIYDRGSAMWSPLSGIHSDLTITYLVGATYFGSDQANVNTNAFTYALAQSGYLGYAAIVFGVTAFFKLLDALYEGSANAGYLYIGFLYAILLAEQAATTAFVSSGVGLLFILVVLSGTGRSLGDVAVGYRPKPSQPVRV